MAQCAGSICLDCKKAMKYLFLFVLLSLIFGQAVNPSPDIALEPPGMTNRIDKPPCPTLNVTCPTYVVSGNSPLTLKLDSSGLKKGLKGDEVVTVWKGVESKDEVSYKWEVSGANILTGQGTRTV